ncbi:hypothetical protein [Neomoorella thermoacetica]|uniref:hypothetical protein n=1 Tax=Neomoorella thermoacetica TaxID=1525 RepID=UPI0018C8A1F7|nr:hypothetical protein [Moorella thermoacetica]
MKKKVIETYVVKFSKAPEETRPSKNFLGKPKQKKESGNHEEENRSGSNFDPGPSPGGSGLGRK